MAEMGLAMTRINSSHIRSFEIALRSRDSSRPHDLSIAAWKNVLNRNEIKET
jgi:hypothetical protein